eukprot:SAG31_NODE_696_length_12754_cov_9.480759_6_plen_134_part_00
MVHGENTAVQRRSRRPAGKAVRHVLGEKRPFRGKSVHVRGAGVQCVQSHRPDSVAPELIAGDEQDVHLALPGVRHVQRGQRRSTFHRHSSLCARQVELLGYMLAGSRPAARPPAAPRGPAAAPTARLLNPASI